MTRTPAEQAAANVIALADQVHARTFPLATDLERLGNMYLDARRDHGAAFNAAYNRLSGFVPLALDADGVEIKQRECPDTGEYESDCDCPVHAPRVIERCDVTGDDEAECGCRHHRDHPDL